MKKFVLLISLLIMTVSGASASRKVFTLVSGSADVFKENAIATFSIDTEETTWERTQSLKRYFAEDFDKCMGDAIESFIIGFNKSSNGLRIKNDAQDAKYKIVLKADNYHCSVGAFYKKYVVIYGTMEVTDIASGEKVCELNVIGFMLGKTDYLEKTAFVNAHFAYAEYLQELVKKDKLKLKK